MNEHGNPGQESGQAYWAAGLSLLMPYLGGILQLVLPAILLQQARSNPSRLVRENARWAANWNLTCFVLFHSLSVASMWLGVITFVFLIDELFTWAIILMCLACLIAVVHLVVTAIGIVVAGRRIFRPVMAIPFFRETEPEREEFVTVSGEPVP
ncbi:hypothetical protein XM48_00825 [Leucobacter sp. Ag1]|nr:DUF4870 domain-containing protein [Leucobacter sp. Ag1]KKI22630.1 hypothetical protein XM48_00825 [Leucobacter sp. Ag1]